jgi:small redox-active disulfide protein 2
MEGFRMKIKILGPGCARCQQLEKLVRQAVDEAGVEATVEKVSDIKEIAGYGVFTTPGVVVDDVVKSVGKIPRKEEILGWLKA